MVLKAEKERKPLIVEVDSADKNSGLTGNLFVVEVISILILLTACEFWQIYFSFK